MIIPVYKREKEVSVPNSLTIKKNNYINTYARINVRDGIIEVNEDYLRKNFPERFFVFLHEIGHIFYYTEHKCDFFASSILYNAMKMPKKKIVTIVKKLIKDKNRKNKVIYDIKTKL